MTNPLQKMCSNLWLHFRCMERFPMRAFASFVFMLCWFGVGVLNAQIPTEADRLEKRLAEAEGAERLELLTTLVEHYAAEDPTQALVYGEEALELLVAHPANPLELPLRNALGEAHGQMGAYRRAHPESA